MSLLRLLTAGKSLVGLKDTPSPYQVTSQRLLPKFNSKKNPFRTTAKPDLSPLRGSATEQELALAPASVQESAESNSTAAASAPVVAKPVEAPVNKPQPVTAPQVVQRPAASQPGKIGSTLSGLFSWRRAKPAQPAVPRFGKPMVQAELSLEKIRVVRNDLSDSDLEVVRVKRAAKPAAQPQVPVAPAPKVEKPADPETTWNRVTGRLFGAGKA